MRRGSSGSSGSNSGSTSGSASGGVEWSDLQLGNVLPISDFLSSFTSPFDNTMTRTTMTKTTTTDSSDKTILSGRGVFVLEDINQQVIVVDYHDSNEGEVDRKEDLFSHIQASIDYFSQYQPVAIRVQTFSSTAPPGLPKAYAEELRRHINPMNPPLSTTTTTTSTPTISTSSTTTTTTTTTSTTTSPNPVITVEVDDNNNSSSGDHHNHEEQIVSPFANTSNQVKEAEASTVSEVEEELPLTVSNVENTLDKIRPYLIADGGNVAVVAIDEDTRSIQLILEGACGSCPSSTVGHDLLLTHSLTHSLDMI